jgi:hypothetical protein
MQQVDIPMAIRARGKLGAAGDGVMEQALDEPVGERLNGRPLMRVVVVSGAATREAYITQLMLEALDLTGDRDAALVRFARSVSSTEAETLRQALATAEDPPVRERRR